MKIEIESKPESMTAVEQLRRLNELEPTDDWLENMNRRYMSMHLTAEILKESAMDQEKLNTFFSTRPAPLEPRHM